METQKITAAPSDPLADLDWAGFAREALSTEPAGCLRMALAGAGSPRAACALAELALEAIETSGQPDPWGSAEVAAWVVEGPRGPWEERWAQAMARWARDICRRNPQRARCVWRRRSRERPRARWGSRGCARKPSFAWRCMGKAR